MTKFKRIVKVALKHIEYTKALYNLTPEHLQELNDYLDQELEYYYMESNNGN